MKDSWIVGWLLLCFLVAIASLPGCPGDHPVLVAAPEAAIAAETTRAVVVKIDAAAAYSDDWPCVVKLSDSRIVVLKLPREDGLCVNPGFTCRLVRCPTNKWGWILDEHPDWRVP